MKNKTVLGFLVTCVFMQPISRTALAQWTISGTDIYNSNTGEVGVGNTAPAYMLDVLNLNTTRALNLNSTYAGASTKYGIYNTVSNDGTGIRYGLYSTVSATTGTSNTVYGLRSAVTNNGTGISYGVYSSVSGTSTGTKYGVYSSASGSTNYAFYGSGRGYFSDNVGLGTSSPVGKLHITNVEVSLASGGSLILGLTTGVNMAFDANEIHVRNNGAAGTLYLNPEGGTVIINNAGTVTDVSLTGDGALQMGDESSTNIAMDNNEIQARNNGAASGLFLNASGGNVYVGTTSGSEKLNVCGGILATEVRVESGWCDYVFEKEYKLISLTDLETFVNENKHLPNIPAASEIQQHGLPLADVTTRMMEKIEELTLYVLQLNTRVTQLETENALLRSSLTTEK
jgi:hypothetical protein